MELTFNISENKTLHVKITVDHFRGIIHVLDLNKGNIEVSNAIDTIQEKILSYCRLERHDKWSWFIYKSNGTVSNFINNNFDYMPLTDERVYPAFIGEMLIRINRRLLENTLKYEPNGIAI